MKSKIKLNMHNCTPPNLMLTLSSMSNKFNAKTTQHMQIRANYNDRIEGATCITNSQ